MSKLVVFAAALVALLALAQANRFTVTTTLDEEDDNQRRPGGQSPERCQRQIQQQYQQLRQCQQYLQSERGRSPFEEDMTIQEYGQQGPGQQQQQQQLRGCCRALESFDNDWCRCDAVRSVVRQQMRVPGEEIREIRERARFLPRECNLGPQECQI